MDDYKIVFSAILFLAAVLTPVHCGGTVELRLIQYYNKHGHDSTWDHCDSFLGLIKISKCDPFFEIKMSGQDKRGNGISWSMVKTKVYHETNTVSFNHDLGPALHNPIKRHFARWMGYFNMEVKVMDHDPITAHDHIDTIKVSLLIHPGNRNTPRIAKGTKHGLDSRLTFAVSVRCDEHYYGPSCKKRCVPRDDFQGHFTCTEEGNIKCLPTWHDVDTKCRRRDVCDPNPCLHGGNCSLLPGDRFQCACRPDYHGHTCEVRTKPCEAHDHCLNGGVCVNDDLKRSHCKCQKGWTGRFCEVDKNECNSTDPPCQNGATCVNQPGSFHCKCTPQFTGPKCDEDVDECDDQDPKHPLCLHNGTCVNTVGGFECDCPEGINGTHCEIRHSFTGTLTEIIRKLRHNHSYAMVVLSSFFIVIMCLLGLAVWKRRVVAYHAQLIIKNRHKRPPARLFFNTDDEEPRLEFKNSVYDTLDESEANREMKYGSNDGVTNVAYITDDASPESPRRRTQGSTGTDLRINAIIDSGDGYVQLPDDSAVNDTTPEVNDEEKLKKLFDDPAKFPPEPISLQNTPKTLVSSNSGADKMSVS